MEIRGLPGLGGSLASSVGVSGVRIFECVNQQTHLGVEITPEGLKLVKEEAYFRTELWKRKFTLFPPAKDTC